MANSGYNISKSSSSMKVSETDIVNHFYYPTNALNYTKLRG